MKSYIFREIYCNSSKLIFREKLSFHLLCPLYLRMDADTFAAYIKLYRRSLNPTFQKRS